MFQGITLGGVIKIFGFSHFFNNRKTGVSENFSSAHIYNYDVSNIYIKLKTETKHLAEEKN